MRTWLAIGVVFLVGAVGGISAAVVRVQLSRWDGTPNGSMSSAPPDRLENTGETLPKVVCEEDTHDFGAMDSHATGSHTFILTNVGSAPLTLTKGQTSCKCTAVVPTDKRVPPGGSGNVAVQWTGKEKTGSFTQTATIITNDPAHREVTLTIKGRITRAVRAVPSRLTLSGLNAGDERSAKIKLFGYRPKPLEVTAHEFSNPDNAESFVVSFEPLSAEQIAEEQDATSGQLVVVTVKPGLPQGPFQQKILLTTNCEEAPTVEVPVRGMIGSEISIVGRGWDAKRGCLRWETIRGREGAQRKLFIRVSGPHRKEVSFKPIKIFPDLLKVKLGETTLVEDGKFALTALTIEVPKGSPPAHYLDPDEEKNGEILLETTHPKARELRILVAFAVEG
jgi:hypothetical protein